MAYTTTQTLKYAHREEDIATLAHALDLLGHRRIPEAIAVLMAYRDRLMEAQTPVLKQYDPREDRP